MSTREGPPGGAGLPGEVQHPPTETDVARSTSPMPTPGVALAGARFPGAPTLPDWDPMSMTQAIQRIANDLFQAPPMTAHLAQAGAPPAGMPTALGTTPPLGGAPLEPLRTGAPDVSRAEPVPAVALLAPLHTHAPPSAPSASAPSAASPTSVNPFFTAPSFDAMAPLDGVLGAMAFDADALRFPLLDRALPEDAPHTEGAPSFVPPAGAPGFSSAPDAARVPVAGLDPLAVPALGALGSGTGAGFDAHAIKREFPILEERVHGKRLVWLDNAATTQKPRAVIDRVKYFYEHENSNIHRAAHALAARATDAYEAARESVRKFINAPSVKEIVFVRGATEGINLVAKTWGKQNVKAGDEIVLTNLEHHANIVPWQQLAEESGAKIRVAPVDDRGQILLDEYEKLLGPKTRIVAMPQVSNALGTITPAKEMIAMAHRHGAKVLLDGAQSVSHMRVDVQQLDADFFVFSGHKIFAPTGIGAVFGKAALLEHMVPWQGGGNMIQDVTFERTQYQPAPMRFEAGTGNIADAVGLGAALEWLTRVGIDNVDRHEHDLLVYATQELQKVRGLKIIGTAAHKAGVISFTLAGHTTMDVAEALDKEGIAVRGGHHCAQPILRRFGLESSVRASFAPYNTMEDVDALAAALHRMQESAQ